MKAIIYIDQHYEKNEFFNQVFHQEMSLEDVNKSDDNARSLHIY